MQQSSSLFSELPSPHHFFLLFRDVGKRSLCKEQNAGHGDSILKRGAHDFRGVDDARLYQINISSVGCIKAIVASSPSAYVRLPHRHLWMNL